MATAVQELIYRIKFDPATATADTQKFAAAVQASLRQVGITEKQQAAAALSVQRQTEAAKLRAFQQSINQISREEQKRVTESVRSANQRLREEQRTAREIARITADTARQAAAQERIRERAAKQLADVQIREAKRAAKELERSIAASRSGRSAFGGGDITGAISSIAGRLPVVGPQISGLTSEISGLTSGALAAEGAFVAAASGLALFVAGAGAGIATVALLGKAIFDTAKQAAEFQGKFFDLSQQVGVSVETLSTLDVIASTTGGNIETVTASMGIFQKGLENAHDPTSEEAKLLKQLGVTSLDTEAALRQTIAGLFKMGEGAKQTDAVLQLFGRSGRFVNAILKESQGDLDAATKKFSEMGLIVSTEAAAAADQFNDSLEILNREIAATTRGLVSDAIPVFTVFFQQINESLTGNKNDWSSWSNVIKIEVAAALGTVRGFAQYVASLGNIPLTIAIDANIRSLIEDADKLTNKLRFEADVQRIQRLTQSILAGKPGDRPKPGKDEAEGRAAKSIQLQQQALEESTRAHRERLERERQLDLKSIEGWKETAINLELDHRDALEEIFDAEAANVRRFVKNQEDAELALKAIGLKRLKAANEAASAIQKIEDEAQKRSDDAELKHLERIFKQTEAERQQRLELIRQYSEREATILDAQLEAETQRFNERKSVLEQELNALSTTATRQVEIRAELTRIETDFTTTIINLSNKRIEAIRKEIEEWQKLEAAQSKGPAEGRKVEEDLPKNPVDLEDLGPPPPPDFSPWREAIRGIKSEMREFSHFAASAMRDAALGAADALAQGVEAWALYGESFGKAMKRALAASLARIAGEATFQGALHTAWALGSLAFGDFSGAAKHGIAAAKFFAVAAATGLAARAIAGNTFKQDSSAGGGAGSAGSSGPQQLNPLTFNRNQPNPPRTIVLQIQSNDSHIVKVVGADIRNAGQLRELILNDGTV